MVAKAKEKPATLGIKLLADIRTVMAGADRIVLALVWLIITPSVVLLVLGVQDQDAIHGTRQHRADLVEQRPKVAQRRPASSPRGIFESMKSMCSCESCSRIGVPSRVAITVITVSDDVPKS